MPYREPSSQLRHFIVLIFAPFTVVFIVYVFYVCSSGEGGVKEEEEIEKLSLNQSRRWDNGLGRVHLVYSWTVNGHATDDI